MEETIVPVILSGGAGTRLWPLSREERPKQLLPLLGEETMIQLTARRVADRRFARPWLVTGESLADEAEGQMAAVGMAPERTIVEPCPRNTAAAAAAAALIAEPDRILLLMPSDHLIACPEIFRNAAQAALPLARDGWIVTFGIRPDRPETGYGYIRRGEPIGEGVFRCEAFVEKPDAARARRYLDEGHYDWNAGIFLFRAGTLLAAFEEHAPEIVEAVRRALPAPGEGRIRLAAEAFAKVRSASVDTAVMERFGRIAVAPVDMGWSDIGSWDALHEALDKDEAGNAGGEGEVTALGVSGCFLKSSGPRLVAIGIEDLIVVATADGVLVVPRGQSQRVKEGLDALARKDPGADD